MDKNRVSMKISVRKFTGKGSYLNVENSIEIEVIKRIPFNKGFFGNFVPHFCRYKKKIYTIQGSIDYAYMHGFENDSFIIINKPKPAI